MTFMFAVLSETAFCSSECSTISGGIAWRAGIIRPLVTPCANAAISRCSQRSRSANSSVATTAALIAAAICPSWRIIRFERPSASTPP